MPQEAVDRERLDSWKSIAVYLGKNERTVIRWEKERGLPIHRIPGGQRHGVFAYRDELDAWLKKGANDEALNINPELPPVAPSQLKTQAGRLRLPGRRRWVLAIAAILVLSPALAFAIFFFIPPRTVQFTGIVQLTQDGLPKQGLETDGKFLYFGEWKNGWSILSKIPLAGGTPIALAIPPMNAEPVSISPDGRRLLVLAQEGMEKERPLWIVPVAGGLPHRVGTIRCHSALWSQDGAAILFATGHGIYRTYDDGASVQKIHDFAEVPVGLQWKLGGGQLRFELVDERSQYSLWDLRINGHEAGAASDQAVPLKTTFQTCCQSFAILDPAGQEFFVSGWHSSGGIKLLRRKWGISGPEYTSVDLNDRLRNVWALTDDRSAHKLYALVSDSERTNLLRYEASTQAFQSVLPGVSALELDYSRDGRWVSYVSVPDGTLWVSRSDGGERRQIAFQANDIELPRWSPDGRSIAFMAKLANRPWRIYVVPAAGATPREASIGSDNQGAPTWSPDGRRIAYGNVECQETRTCAIHTIDLVSGQESTVPGSEGMGTARWSPDGRFIAALYPEQRQVYLFNVTTRHWRLMADGINGNDLSWSADSKSLYASNPEGASPEILRISITDGKATRIIDLSKFSLMTGEIGDWFTVAPDGAIILPYRIHPAEVYSLNYVER